MSSLVALSISIAVLGGIATFLALGPLAGFILIWAIFIGWATYFAAGTNIIKAITCNLFGLVCAWAMAMILLNTPLGGMGALGASIAVAVTVLVLCLAAHMSALDSIPASVYGYAATAAYLLQKDGALDTGMLTGANFSNAAILIGVSLIVGAIFGLISAKAGEMLSSD